MKVVAEFQKEFRDKHLDEFIDVTLLNPPGEIHVLGKVVDGIPEQNPKEISEGIFELIVRVIHGEIH